MLCHWLLTLLKLKLYGLALEFTMLSFNQSYQGKSGYCGYLSSTGGVLFRKY